MAMNERISDLLRNPGERRHLSRTVAAEGLALSESRVPDGADLVLDLTLDSLGDKIAVSGTVTHPWEGSCRRCLGTVRGRSTVEIHEVYSRLDDGDSFPLEGDEIDLEPLVREAVLLELPIAPLCEETCRGPAPEEYPAEPWSEPDPDAPRPKDPRWAALDDLDLG